MSRELPQKVKAGQPVSASWLNSVVDYLRYLDEQQLRRKILRGTGYAARESAGGTTLSIDRQTFARENIDGLDVRCREDFRLRIKPKGLCRVDENGNWDKVVQVHKGRVTNHQELELEVKEMAADTQGEPSGKEAPNSDPDWVDVKPLQADEKAEAVEVYVRLDAYPPTKAEFVSSIPQNADKKLYIPIGKATLEMAGEAPRYYLHQYQLGPVELGGAVGGGGTMPFDVSLVSVQVEQEKDEDADDDEDEEEELETKTCLAVESGRVFLSDGRHTTIPPKGPEPADPNNPSGPVNPSGLLEVEPGYLVLSVYYDSPGTLIYKYSIESTLPGTAVTPREDTSS